MATIDVLLNGFSFSTSEGRPAFCSVTLVESKGFLILVDPAHVGRRRELSSALEQRGLTESSIDAVVLTHAHWDHAQNFDHFVEAPVLLHTRERRYANSPHKNDWATPPWTGTALETHQLQEVVEGDELAAGVHVIDLPGHSVGSIGLLVETEDGMACVAGDAIHSSWVLESGQPPIVFASLSQARESVAKALSSASIIYPGHDRPFRVENGEADYLQPFALTITNLDPEQEGLRFETGPPSTWTMPGSAP